MASVLQYIKEIFYFQQDENVENVQRFQTECLQRIGKQFFSIIISCGLIRSQYYANSRDVSSAFKKIEPYIIKKLKLEDKRQLYKIFGNYCFSQISSIPDQNIIQLEIMTTFMKILTVDNKASRNQFAKDLTLRQDDTSTIASFNDCSRDFWEQLEKMIEERLKQNGSTEESIKFTRDLTFQKKQQEENIGKDEDSFFYTKTQDQVQKRKINLCEKHFVDVVNYLEKLSSPQSQLTYIWQHLKWQGFEAYYEPYMNQFHQWTCYAKIYIPPDHEVPKQQQKQEFLMKSRRSKNKKKAKQLACMDLLKSLYLLYPEVWLIYKHLRQQKKLAVPPLDGPKDQDQIEIIRNRKDYHINKEKIQKLFKHSKTDIRKMMEGISAKAELNTLLQQLAGRVTSPKMEKKMIEGNNWSVPVKIEYKTYEAIQNNKAPQVYTETVIFHNTKVAEEEAYMEAIINMYQENPDLFQKIQSIKLAKNIKDSPKKLQLLRVAKYQQKQIKIKQ